MKISIICNSKGPIKGAIFIDNEAGAEMMAEVLRKEAKSNDIITEYYVHTEILTSINDKFTPVPMCDQFGY